MPEIVETSAGPRVRRGNRLVPVETQARLEAENSARLRALHAEPGRKDMLRARMKGLWADPVWSAEFKRRQSARIKAINDAIDQDPARREKRARLRRALLTDLNKDPEFQRRRREGAKAGYAKRDTAALAAHHQNVTVQTINGPVVMRRYQARLFEQFRLAIGDAAALAKVIRPPKRCRKRRMSRAALLARQAQRAEALLAKLAPAIAAAFDISIDDLVGETRGAPRASTLRKLLMVVLVDVYGVTRAAAATALRRSMRTVTDTVREIRARMPTASALERDFTRMRIAARAIVRPRTDRRQVAARKEAA